MSEVVYIESFNQFTKFSLLQHLINFSLKHYFAIVIVKVVVHKLTLQCKVSLLIRTFCLDISVRRVSFSWSAFFLLCCWIRTKKYCFTMIIITVVSCNSCSDNCGSCTFIHFLCDIRFILINALFILVYK
jgi:hypothetical protein